MISVNKIEIVNKIIEKISQTKRGFLRTRAGIGLVLLQNKRLFYRDHYKGHLVYMHGTPSSISRKFTSGGTLQSLVFEEFKDFIMGKEISEENSGLNGTHWGIPQNEIDELKKFARNLGYFS